MNIIAQRLKTKGSCSKTWKWLFLNSNPFCTTFKHNITSSSSFFPQNLLWSAPNSNYINNCVPLNCMRQLHIRTVHYNKNDDSDQKNTGNGNVDYKTILERDSELKNILQDITNDFNDSNTPDGPTKRKTRSMEIQKSAINRKACDACGPASQDLPRSTEGKFGVFDETRSEEILDFVEEQEQQQFYLYQRKPDLLKGYDSNELKRGKEGVFDIAELVTVLQQENARDIAVISVPKQFHYCDYLVLVTARSPRHLNALVAFLRKLHKKKKLKEDAFIVPEGRDCENWKVLDMANIVLHFFLEATREHYDLETLWTVGEQYDELSHQEGDPVLDKLQKHIQYLDEIETLPFAKTQ